MEAMGTIGTIGTMTRYPYDENQSARRVKNRRSCNSQICCAYVFSVFAVALIVGGMYLSYIHWTKVWLILTVVGIIVNLFGSCLYYSGSNRLHHRREEHIYENRTRRRRYRNRGLSTDQLMPSAPPLNQSRSVSQLSLNMIPQYFCSNDSEAISVANQSNTTSITPLATTLSQIFSVNGQSFLILPLNGEPLNPSNSFPLQNLVVKLENEMQTKDKTDTKVVEREDMSCQTDSTAIDMKRGSVRCKDVQLQTLSRTQLDQINNDVITGGQRQGSIAYELIQSTSSHNCNGVVVDSSDSNGCSSNDSTETNSLEPFGSQPSSLDTQTVVTLIDLNENNYSAPQEGNQRDNTFYTESANHLVSYRVGDRAVGMVDNECFNGMTNENPTEEGVDDSLSILPPSYEDVIDYRDDDNEGHIIVDYGTL